MNTAVTLTLTDAEVDALTLAISDANYWAHQMRNGGNFRDADRYEEQAKALQGILDANA